MIQRVKELTAEEAETLGTAWTSQEGITYDPASFLTLHSWMREMPHTQNLALQNTWQHVSSVATVEGRADELDAAIEAEKTAEHVVRRMGIPELAKAGAVEAARSAVLAVGVRDVIADAAYELLVGPWQKTFGAL